jgi:hypothetical protein
MQIFQHKQLLRLPGISPDNLLCENLDILGSPTHFWTREGLCVYIYIYIHAHTPIFGHFSIINRIIKVYMFIRCVFLVKWIEY